MKRLFIFGLMLASAFALTNCSQEIEPPIQEDDVTIDESIKEDTTPEEVVSIPFEVYANSAADEAETKTTNEGNNTKWAVGDDINVYHSVHNANDYVNNHAFVIADTEKGLFGGGLKSSLTEETYDWCFLYPYDENRGNTLNSDNCPEVTIGLSLEGNYTHANIKADSKEHIQGKNYPMYGLTTLDNPDGVNKSDNPKVRMKHLSALVAIKVVNQGDASKNDLTANKDGNEKQITINEITFSVPKINTVDANKKTVKQSALPIVGAFNVDITGEVSAASFSPVSGKTSNSVTLSLQQSVPIDPGKDTTFYLAVRPFDAVNNVDEFDFTNKNAITLDISINGSKRTVEIPADTKFEAGKVTTLRVPVKLDYPKASDAIALTSKGTKSDDKAEKILTLPDPRDMNINGETVPVYVLGENGNKGTITVRGYAKDMFAALPVGFYASRWNDLPTAMTLHSINAWLPEYKNNGNWLRPNYDYTDINKRTELRSYGSLAAFNIILSILGIKLFDNTYGILRTTIESFVDNIAKMTFKGMVTNGDFDNNNVIILDENPVYKEVSSAKVDEFLSSFSADVNGKKCVATCAGLMSILIDATANSDGSLTFPDDESRILAEDTANAIFYKLENTIAKVNENLKGLIGVFFSDPTDLMRKLRDTKFQIVIETRPYEDTEGAPLNPIVFWGFDAYGPDDSVPEN